MSRGQGARRGPQGDELDSGLGLDTLGLRAVLGRFATGVAIITATTADQRPVGITVNSFTSVSLTPPLIMWCVARSAQSGAAFQNEAPFVVNVLNAGQADLARRFAGGGEDKFEGLGYGHNEEGVAVLHGCGARVDCVVDGRYPGGDHEIIVGRVLRYQQAAADPLIFYAGKFRTLRGMSFGEASDMLLGFQ